MLIRQIVSVAVDDVEWGKLATKQRTKFGSIERAGTPRVLINELETSCHALKFVEGVNTTFEGDISADATEDVRGDVRWRGCGSDGFDSD